MGLFTPAWMSQDEEKALKAVKKLEEAMKKTGSDAKWLKLAEQAAEVVRSAPLPSVREAGKEAILRGDTNTIFALEDEEVQQQVATKLVRPFVEGTVKEFGPYWSSFSVWKVDALLEVVRLLHDEELVCRAFARLLTYDSDYSDHFTAEDIDRIEDVDVLIGIGVRAGRSYQEKCLAVSQAILAKIKNRAEILSNDKLFLILDASLPSEFHALAERTLLQRKIPPEECAELALQAKNYRTVRFFLKRKMRTKPLLEETAIKLLDGKGAFYFSDSDDNSEEIETLLSYVSSEEALHAILRSAYNSQVQQAILQRVTDESRLGEAVRNDQLRMKARKIALINIKDEGILVEIAKGLKTGENRVIPEGEELSKQAISQLSHRQDSLAEVALQGTYFDVNLDAVAGINDETHLFTIAQQADHTGVRRAAAEKITDQSLLSALAQDYKVYESIVLSLAQKLADKKTAQVMCVEYLIKKSAHDYDKEVFGFVFEQAAFFELVREAPYYGLQREALANITDQSLIAGLAKEHRDADTRIRAAERLVDTHLAQEAYLSVAKDNSVSWQLRSTAAERIENLESKDEVYLSVLNHVLEGGKRESYIIPQIAEAAPTLIKANWGRVRAYASKHHSDNPNSYHKDCAQSDCSHIDNPTGRSLHHRDIGLGNKYLDTFPPQVRQ